MDTGVPPATLIADIARHHRQRAVGRIGFSATVSGTRTLPMRIEERGSLRIRLPRGEVPGLDAVLVNTAGGIACGDRFEMDIEAKAGTSLTIATPAAEKVYRSDGATSHLTVRLALGPSARLDWLPQETILFDRARLVRRVDVTMAENARLTLAEAVVFGRAARAETVTHGLFEDRWRIRRGGRLVYAETLRLVGPIAELLRKPSVANGARALATLIHVAPDAEDRLEEVRATLVPHDRCDVAASAWNGLLAVRFCAATIETLRDALCSFLVAFRGEPLPRVWLS